MPVWKVTISEVKAERLENIPGKVTVEVKPAIGDAELEEAGNTKLVRVRYSLAVNYNPGVGSIKVGGSMYLVGVDAEKALDGKKIADPQVVQQVFQRIFVEPMVMAINVAKELMLPLPVRMPEVKVEKKS